MWLPGKPDKANCSAPGAWRSWLFKKEETYFCFIVTCNIKVLSLKVGIDLETDVFVISSSLLSILVTCRRCNRATCNRTAFCLSPKVRRTFQKTKAKSTKLSVSFAHSSRFFPFVKVKALLASFSLERCPVQATMHVAPFGAAEHQRLLLEQSYSGYRQITGKVRFPYILALALAFWLTFGLYKA